MKKTEKYIYTFVFAALLGIVPVSTFFKIGIPDKASFARIEKRNPATFPAFTLDLTAIESFFKQLENYINDNYSFRSVMITSWSSLIFETGSSANQHKVVVGKNGFLFLGNHFDNMINTVKGKNVFDKQGYLQWSRSFLIRKNYLDKKHIPFYMAIVPKKHNVYPEYLPDYLIPAKETIFTRIRDYNNRLEIQYLIDTLLNAKATWGDLLYSKTDSHWSKIGAYVGYRSLIDNLKVDFPALKPVILDTSDFIIRPHPGGQNRVILRISQEIDDFTVAIRDSDKWKKELIKTNYDGDTLPFHHLYPIGYKEKAIVYNPDAPYTVLLFEDSFSITLSTYLNQSFGKIIYCHYGEPEAVDFSSLVEKHKPDLVIYQFGEQSVLRHKHLNEELQSQYFSKTVESIAILNGKELFSYLSWNHQINNVLEGNDVLTFESTGVDPNIVISEKAFGQNILQAVRIRFTTPQSTAAQLFFQHAYQHYTEKESVVMRCAAGLNDLLFVFPEEMSTSSALRFDPGNLEGNYEIHEIEFFGPDF